MMDEKIIQLDMGTLDSNVHSVRPTLCLGIESSCDETSAAIVDSDRNILAHIIYTIVPRIEKIINKKIQNFRKFSKIKIKIREIIALTKVKINQRFYKYGNK